MRAAKRLTRKELEAEVARLRDDLLTVSFRIAHDLRTPLGGIIYSGEASKEILADHFPDGVALVSSSLQSAAELAEVIKRVSFVLLATARPMPLGRISMRQAVSAAWERLESKTIKAGATVTMPKSWPEVDGVEDWLDVVWSNLLSNALQYGGPSPGVELGWEARNNEYRFWVSDHGPGVPEARRQKLFQPFHTLHQPDSTRGLGLPIVQRLVELQGGSCGYEPMSPVGSRFFFVLPIPAPES